MKGIRMSHAFSLKSLFVMSPYVVRDREFLIRVKHVVLLAHKLVNNEIWCANFAKISSIAK